MFTYRMLAEEIEKMSDKQKDCEVKVSLPIECSENGFTPQEPEFASCFDISFSKEWENHILPHDYPYLSILSI